MAAPPRYARGVEHSADILISSVKTGHPELVVEVKTQSASMEKATDYLRRYMQRTGVPLGLVVAGSRLRLLRDSFSNSTSDSIVVAWDVDAVGVDALSSSSGGPPSPSARGPWEFAFVSRVQDWLESLSDPSEVARLPAALRPYLVSDVVPIIETGAVSAAGPRFQRTARHA